MPSPKAWDILHNEALSRGLVGHWKLNALTGASSNIAQDVGPNGLHGTAVAKDRSTGTPIALPSVVSGKIRNALDFNPTSGSANHQWVTLGNSALVRPANLSVSAWVYIDNDASHRGHEFGSEIVANYRTQDVPAKGFLLRHSAPTNDWRFWVYAGGAATQAQWVNPTTFNTWYHVLGTYDGTYVCVYVNGVLRDKELHTGGGNMEYGTTPDVETQMAGYESDGWASGHGGVMRGRIDEVTMWNRALDAGEVAHLYNAGAGRFFDMKTAGWWEFTGGVSGTDKLDLPGAAAPAFDPAKNTDDFTVAGCFTPDDIAAGWQGILAKYASSSPVDKRFALCYVEERLLVPQRAPQESPGRGEEPPWEIGPRPRVKTVCQQLVHLPHHPQTRLSCRGPVCVTESPRYPPASRFPCDPLPQRKPHGNVHARNMHVLDAEIG